jgi:hypothetical protein
MPAIDPETSESRPRLAMLRETYEQALEVAGEVWPTPTMAIGSLFERGVAFLESGATLTPITGSAPQDVLRVLNEAREELLVTEAQYAFTRYVTYALTRESEQLEATWLALADEHLAIRERIVRCRQEEERLKRELVKLGGFAVPLPEHEALSVAPADRPRKSRGMYAGLFEGASEIRVDLDVDASALASADRIAEQEGWAAEWGEHARLVVFAHGLSAALRDREADAVDPNDLDSVREAQQQARGRVMGLEGRYATLRFRLFELQHNNRVLSWRITALRVEAGGMQSRLELFERDRARLEDEVETRRTLRGPATEQTDSEESRGWLERLAGLVRRNR